MNIKDLGRVPMAPGSHPSGHAADGVDGVDGAPRVDPSRDAAAVLAEISAHFGPGFSNGVAAILYHPDLPEQFGKEEWADWFFKPAEKAFEWAHDRGLIVPWKLSRKWTFTPLGRAAAELLRSRDSDGSGGAGETRSGSTAGDSAGPQGVAQGPRP